MFEGTLQNIFTCIHCEATNKRKESFFNLSLDLEKNTSLSYCLKRFSNCELLNKDDKFFCESCNTKQVATKQIVITSEPKLLLIHMKRFKIDP